MSLAWRNLQKPFYLETSLRILQMRPSLSLGASRIAVPKLTLHTKHSMPPCDFSDFSNCAPDVCHEDGSRFCI
ncbi:alanine-glyoxylate aminotransferase 2, isoform CRA_d [Mus musculus]|nr:alanine-glyoxylate aminotransferase 2, isoform CRA_d [Mus musculus]